MKKQVTKIYCKYYFINYLLAGSKYFVNFHTQNIKLPRFIKR